MTKSIYIAHISSIQLSFNIILQGSYTEDLRHIYRTDSNEFPIIDICRHWLCCIFGSCMAEESCWELTVQLIWLGQGCCPQLSYNHIQVDPGQCFPEKRSVAIYNTEDMHAIYTVWCYQMLAESVNVKLQIFLMVDNKMQFIESVNITLCYTF